MSVWYHPERNYLIVYRYTGVWIAEFGSRISKKWEGVLFLKKSPRKYGWIYIGGFE